MKLSVPDSVLKIASYLDKPLFIVGGFVRDSLKKLAPHDIDLCGDMDWETVVRRLENTEFNATVNSKKLMTLKIIAPDAEYEYTAFRTDSYKDGHSPDSVTRTNDIKIDALRRDFTANAVYYDPVREEIFDPLGGVKDIEKNVLRMTRKNAFSEDGLRLMRLARQAAELGFSVEKETLAAAKENAKNIKDISRERIRDELDRILVADTRYNIPYAQEKGLLLLDEIGVLEYILPEITKGKGMAQRPDFHRFDVFGHIINTVKLSTPEVRLAALLHDCAKPYCFLTTGKYRGHDLEGERISAEIMNRLRYPNCVISETKRLVRAHMFDLKGDAKENTVRKFIQSNIKIFDKLLLLKQADYEGSGIMTGVCPGCVRLKYIYDEMKKEKVPFTLSELKIGGLDLVKMNVPESLRGKILYAVLEECALKGVDLSKENQFNIAKRKFKEYTNGNHRL